MTRAPDSAGAEAKGGGRGDAESTRYAKRDNTQQLTQPPHTFSKQIPDYRERRGELQLTGVREISSVLRVFLALMVAGYLGILILHAFGVPVTGPRD